MSSLEISAKTSLVSCQSTNNGVKFEQRKRAIIKGCEPQHLLQLKFAMGVENKVKVTQDLQCTGNDSPGRYKVLLKKGKIKLIMH